MEQSPLNPGHPSHRSAESPTEGPGPSFGPRPMSVSIGVPDVAYNFQSSSADWAGAERSLNARPVAPGPPNVQLPVRGAALPQDSVAKRGIDYRHLARAFFRRWIPASILGLVASLIVAAVTWNVVPAAKYTATARLHVASVPPTFLYKTREAATDYSMFRQTQLALLKSQQVLDSALGSPEVAELKVLPNMVDPSDWLREQLSISFASGSEVLEISLSGDHPQMVAVLVNAVMAAYMDEVVNADHIERKRRLEKLKEIWKNYDADLKLKREQLREIAAAIGSDDKKALTLQKQYEIDRQDLVRRNLIEVHGELLKRRAELEFASDQGEGLSQQPAPGPDASELEAALQNDPAIARHAENIRRYKEELVNQSRAVRKPGLDPSISAIRNRINAEQLALANRRKQIRPLLAAELRRGNGGESSPDKARALRDHVAMLEKLEGQYEHELNSIKQETRSFNGKSFDFGLLQTEVELDEKAAVEVGDEIRHVELELNQAAPRIRTFEKAKTPRMKDHDRKYRLTAMSGAAAFILILAAMTFWEYQAQRVGLADDVTLTTGMSLVGTLPAVSLPRSSRQSLSRAGSSSRRTDLLIESIDTTRLMLFRAAQDASHRVVMITSAVPGEGKTSLASHLAVSVARSGRRTLLVDCDLRKPCIHDLFDAPLSPGLCDYLRGEVELQDVVRTTALSNLALISAGALDDQALTALARSDLRPMFSTLKSSFDFVIVDSSPILNVADSLLVGQNVDALIFSVMNDVSRIPDVATAYNRVTALGMEVLGAVLAGTREGTPGSSYSYRYSTSVRSNAT